jgi:GTP-binding protein HflX
MVRFNENNEVLREDDYRAILVGLQRSEDITYYMEELQGLAEAAGIEVAGQMIQARSRPESATYIGKGKVEELSEFCAAMEADTVIFNHELSGMQLRNLEDLLNVRVLDRTILILDIFASRAVSREGKLQVELAQLQYRLPRLTGFGKTLSRLGGGIGTRGPGEKKLETDRRHINRRMDEIKREIEDVKKNRRTQRAQRQRSGIPVVAVVGYTNSGKSALMNRFLHDTNKDDKTVTEADMLFATLDTFQRLISLDTHHSFLLIDTVGFVSHLPHTLVKAFKATLEEVTFADLLLHVVDSSYTENHFHVEVTDQVLKDIGAGDKDRLLVYNKIDLVEPENRAFCEGQDTVCISAKYGDNMDQLVDMIKGRLFSDRRRACLLIPFDRGDIASDLCTRYKPDLTEYRSEGTYMEMDLSLTDYQRLEKYRV